MPIRIVQLGTPRHQDEGPRLGTVRRPPRGVPKAEFARRNFYDAWLPDLAPSEPLVKMALAATTDAEWRAFTKRYRAELKQPDKSRWLDVLAALSRDASFSVGCYCEDERHCHRSILREVLAEHGATLA